MSKTKYYETIGRSPGPDILNEKWLLDYTNTSRNNINRGWDGLQNIWMAAGQHAPISDGGVGYWLGNLTCHYFKWESDGQDHVDQGDTRIYRQWQRKWLNGQPTGERRIINTWNEALRVWRPADIGYGFNHEEEWFNGRKTGKIRGREANLDNNGYVKILHKEPLSPWVGNENTVANNEFRTGGTYIIDGINASGKFGDNKGGTDAMAVWNIRADNQTFNFVIKGNNYFTVMPLENTEILATWFKIIGTGNTINIYHHNGGKLITQWAWKMGTPQKVFGIENGNLGPDWSSRTMHRLYTADLEFDRHWIQGHFIALADVRGMALNIDDVGGNRINFLN